MRYSSRLERSCGDTAPRQRSELHAVYLDQGVHPCLTLNGRSIYSSMPYSDPEKAKARRKAYYAEHREKAIKDVAAWRVENRERRNATERNRGRIRTRTDPEFREYRRQKSRESYAKYHDLRLALAARHRGTIMERARQLLRNAIRRGEFNATNLLQVPLGHAPHSGSPRRLSQTTRCFLVCIFCHADQHAIKISSQAP